MKTTTMVYAALFCVAMVASYLTWTAEPEPVDEEGSVVLIDAKPTEIAKIAYTSKDSDATFEQKSDDLGDFLWVTTTRRVESKSPIKNPHVPPVDTADAGDAGDAAEVAPAPVPPTPPTVKVETAAFKAGKAGEQLLAELAPFRVARKLDVKEGDLADFGLDAPGATLSVTTKSGTTRNFEIGDTAYGHKNVYLRDTASKEVFVMKRSVVSPLERADTKLPEKELFAGEPSAVAKASIVTATGSLHLVQRNRDDAAKASWTAADSDTVNPTADAWLDKVFRLRSTGYLPATQKTETETVFAVKLEFDEGKPVKIEVLRGADEKGEEVWFARSEFTRGLVTLSSGLAADAAADLATLFATE